MRSLRQIQWSGDGAQIEGKTVSLTQINTRQDMTDLLRGSGKQMSCYR